MEYFWIALPFLVTSYMFVFGRTCAFSSITGALFFNPYIDYFDDIQNRVRNNVINLILLKYPIYIHTIFNLVFSFVVPGIYSWYFLHNYKVFFYWVPPRNFSLSTFFKSNLILKKVSWRD